MAMKPRDHPVGELYLIALWCKACGCNHLVTLPAYKMFPVNRKKAQTERLRRVVLDHESPVR